MRNWFESWFDTKYYHILYKNRDHSEAEFFMENISNTLDIKEFNKVLDLACGKGRHATFLNSLGFDVVGVDLSKQSIESAKKAENKKLKFFVHDMREPIKDEKFDYVLNLFTSIGYFDDESDNIKMLQSVHSYLKDDGVLVIDFLNENKVIAELEKSAIKKIEGINFHINKEVVNNVIVKTISFSDNEEDFEFQERVHALKLDDFRKYLSAANFEITKLAGDYHLSDFDKENSDRLIIFAKKR
ncbi:MAG: class I SAM-dependent methyltransferase [Crocinitomicaceae bacterium]